MNIVTDGKARSCNNINWNGEKMLAKYLPQVISATDDTIADVIVADNGSDDGSLELLERSFPRRHCGEA